MASGPAHHAPFNYCQLNTDLQPWLRKRTSRLRSHLQLTAVVVIRIGRELITVKEKLRARTFRRWVAGELPWSMSKVNRLMRVAKVFENIEEVEKMCPSALYVLCWPGAPEAARNEAIAMVREGHKVTHRVAIELLELHRPQQPTCSDERVPAAKKSIALRRQKDAAEPSAKETTTADAQAWRNMQAAAEKFEVVHLSKVLDGDDEPAYTFTGLDDAGKSTTVTRDDLSLAAGALVQSEAEKTCFKCKRSIILGLFSFDRNTVDGRNRRCRDCEKTRREERKKKRLVSPNSPQPSPAA